MLAKSGRTIQILSQENGCFGNGRCVLFFCATVTIGPACSQVAFVLDLAEHVDDLQDCEVRGDQARLADLAEELLRRSAKIGYDGLSRCASAVRGAAREGNTEEARKALIELTETAHRVRLGHRGSV